MDENGNVVLYKASTETEATETREVAEEFVEQINKTLGDGTASVMQADEFMAELTGHKTNKSTKRYHAVWHGSPHSFDKFSLNYIGTGEGAQAYGYGLYFTEKEGIARAYANIYRSKGVEYLSVNWMDVIVKGRFVFGKSDNRGAIKVIAKTLKEDIDSSDIS